MVNFIERDLIDREIQRLGAALAELTELRLHVAQDCSSGCTIVPCNIVPVDIVPVEAQDELRHGIRALRRHVHAFNDSIRGTSR